MSGDAGRSVSEMMRARLAALAPLSLEIADDSAAHAGHAGARGGGGHFALTIVSEAFSGLSPLARHRQVYALLGDLIPGSIHALNIRAFTPREF